MWGRAGTTRSMLCKDAQYLTSSMGADDDDRVRGKGRVTAPWALGVFHNTANTCPSDMMGESMPSSTLPPSRESCEVRGPPVGLPCVTWRFLYPFSHLSTTRIPPLAHHAGQSRCWQYFQLSKICQIHRKSVSETLRRDDTTLQIVLRDLSGETRSNGRTKKVLMTHVILYHPYSSHRPP